MNKKLILIALICIANISYGAATTSGTTTNITYMKVESEYKDTTSNKKVWVKSIGFWSDKTTAELKDKGVTDQIRNLKMGTAKLVGKSFSDKLASIDNLYENIRETLAKLDGVKRTQVGKDGSGIVDQAVDQVDEIKKQLDEIKRDAIKDEITKLKANIGKQMENINHKISDLGKIEPGKVKEEGDRIRGTIDDLLKEVGDLKDQTGGNTDLDGIENQLTGAAARIDGAENKAAEKIKDNEIDQEVGNQKIVGDLSDLEGKAVELKNHDPKNLDQEVSELKDGLKGIEEKLDQIKNNHGENKKTNDLADKIKEIEGEITTSQKNVEARQTLTDEKNKNTERNKIIQGLVDSLNQGKGLDTHLKNNLKNEIENAKDELENTEPIKDGDIDKDRENLKNNLDKIKDVLGDLEKLEKLKKASTGKLNDFPAEKHHSSLDKFGSSLSDVREAVGKLPDGDLKNKLEETIDKIDKDRAETDRKDVTDTIANLLKELGSNPDISKLPQINRDINRINQEITQTLERLNKNKNGNGELIKQFNGLATQLRELKNNQKLKELKNQKSTIDRENKRKQIDVEIDKLKNNEHNHKSISDIQALIDRALRQAGHRQNEKDAVKKLQDKLELIKRDGVRDKIEEEINNLNRNNNLNNIKTQKALDDLNNKIKGIQEEINQAKSDIQHHPSESSKVENLQNLLDNLKKNSDYTGIKDRINANVAKNQRQNRETIRNNIQNEINNLNRNNNLNNIKTQKALDNLDETIKRIEGEITIAQNAAKNHPDESAKVKALETALNNLKNSQAYKKIPEQIQKEKERKAREKAAREKAAEEQLAAAKLMQHTQDVKAKNTIVEESNKNIDDIAKYHGNNIKNILDGLNGKQNNQENKNKVQNIQNILETVINKIQDQIDKINGLKARMGDRDGSLEKAKQRLGILKSELENLKNQAETVGGSLKAPAAKNPVHHNDHQPPKNPGTTTGDEKKTSVEIITGTDSHGEHTGSGAF